MLPRILFKRLQPVLFLPVMIDVGIEELVGLLADVEHV